MQSPTKAGFSVYSNPVYSSSFADPFVLKHQGEYFAYSTGDAADGNVFTVIRSEDLVHWVEVGGAMTPLTSNPPYYWAPEVTYDRGKFYLYYSVGNETLMEIRVAVSDQPGDGFVDSGHRLTSQEFAIDPHVFIDDDGSKYLFYATDFLDHSHIGTGTVVDRMIDWFTLEGNPRPVTRAKYAWQVYDPNRKEKGGVRWYTIEGPSVLKRKGTYYEMFSGGNWQNNSYGVSFAVSRKIADSDEWPQFCDGEAVTPILGTSPGTVIGPGHNCVVRGPNNRELYCVYHRWVGDSRVMAIDRMDFAADRIFVIGPTNTPQPAPFEPKIDGFAPGFSQWKTTGGWKLENRSARSLANGRSELRLSDVPPSFLCELTLRCSPPLSDDGAIGVDLDAGDGGVHLTFHPISNVMRIDLPEGSAGFPSIAKLPVDFDWTAPHLLRIEVDYRSLTIHLDSGAMPKVHTFLSEPLSSLAVFADRQSLEIGSFELTEGFEELFEITDPITNNGWDLVVDRPYRIEAGEILFESVGSFQMHKHAPLASCEFAANFRVVESERTLSEFGLLLRDGTTEILRFAIDCITSMVKVNGESIGALPKNADLKTYHQLRIVKGDNRVLCYFDDVLVHKIPDTGASASCFAFGDNVQLGMEMIRLTAI